MIQAHLSDPRYLRPAVIRTEAKAAMAGISGSCRRDRSQSSLEIEVFFTWLSTGIIVLSKYLSKLTAIASLKS